MTTMTLTNNIKEFFKSFLLARKPVLVEEESSLSYDVKLGINKKDKGRNMKKANCVLFPSSRWGFGVTRTDRTGLSAEGMPSRPVVVTDEEGRQTVFTSSLQASRHFGYQRDSLQGALQTGKSLSGLTVRLATEGEVAGSRTVRVVGTVAPPPSHR